MHRIERFILLLECVPMCHICFLHVCKIIYHTFIENYMVVMNLDFWQYTQRDFLKKIRKIINYFFSFICLCNGLKLSSLRQDNNAGNEFVFVKNDGPLIITFIVIWIYTMTSHCVKLRCKILIFYTIRTSNTWRLVWSPKYHAIFFSHAKMMLEHLNRKPNHFVNSINLFLNFKHSEYYFVSWDWYRSHSHLEFVTLNTADTYA